MRVHTGDFSLEDVTQSGRQIEVDSHQLRH